MPYSMGDGNKSILRGFTYHGKQITSSTGPAYGCVRFEQYFIRRLRSPRLAHSQNEWEQHTIRVYKRPRELRQR